MKCNIVCIILITFLVTTGCRTSREDPKYKLSDGYYQARVFNQHKQRIYISNTEDTISIILIEKKQHDFDSVFIKRNLPQLASDVPLTAASFRQTSFDVDFLTIPFKYRPGTKGFPNQFNTNLNGALYIGYRADIYHLRYLKTPFKNFKRTTAHYGFSYGLFSGLGGTTINPSTTENQLNYEYDGVVWSKGVAGIIAINNFTVGLAVGYDHLLDHNKKYWLYHHQVWVGLAFGLNIN